MTDPALANDLEKIGVTLRATSDTLPRLGRPHFGWDLEKRIAERITPRLTLPTMRVFGGHHYNLVGEQLAGQLLLRARDLGGAAAAAWLDKVCDTHTADVRVVAEVHGLSVSGRIDLPNGVSCASPSSAPLSKRIGALEPSTDDLMSFSALSPPIAVLWADLSSMRWDDEHGGDEAYHKAHEELRQTVLALTLLPGQAPLLTRIWREFADPDLEDAIPGLGWTPQFEDGAALLDPPPTVTYETLGPAVAYLTASPVIRQRLALPISRLGLARRRRQIDNQAIEICTALEAIFGDRNSTTELQYRLSLRAALFLGETLAARVDIRHRSKHLYGMRSRAVHAAGTPRPGDLASVIWGIDLTARAIERILKQGSLPDWSALELSPPPVQP